MAVTMTRQSRLPLGAYHILVEEADVYIISALQLRMSTEREGNERVVFKEQSGVRTGEG